MATRKQLFHPDIVRQKIKTSQLINRLQSFAFGEISLDSTQVRAIEVLLKKSVPDLSAVEMSGPEGGPIETISRIELIAGEG